MRKIPLAAFLLSPIVSMAVLADSPSRLDLTLKTDKKEYVLGEPIRLTFRWSNKMSRNIKLRADYYLSNHIEIVRTDAHQKVRFTTRNRYITPLPAPQPTIKARGFHKRDWLCHTVNLNPLAHFSYDISQPGRYRIWAKGNGQWNDAYVDLSIREATTKEISRITEKDSCPPWRELGVLMRKSPHKFKKVFDAFHAKILRTQHTRKTEADADAYATKMYLVCGVVNYLATDVSLDSLEKIIELEPDKHMQKQLRIVYSEKSNAGQEKDAEGK